MYIIAIIDVDFLHVYLLFFFLTLLACSNLFLSFLMIGTCFSYVDLYPLIIDHIDLNFISLMTKLRLYLFSGIHFPENYFPNFPVFVWHLKNWSTENTFQSKENLTWFPGKCFLEKFGWKTLSGSCEKFKNIILFTDYIKFGPQTFDCYIYILFWIFIFQFHLLKFNFYINFDPHFYNCYLFFPYHFFIEIFYLSSLVLILLIVTYFFWNNLWNVNYYYFNFFIFYFFIF
jgi:hypothetical protein